MSSLMPWKNGHYYSPYPNEEDIERAISKSDLDLSNIQFNKSDHEELWNSLSNTDFSKITWEIFSDRRSFFPVDSRQFVIEDAVVLMRFLLRFSPKQIIEVGSGHSTASMFDIRERAGLQFELTCIEPYPKRLNETLGVHNSKFRLIEEKVQDADEAVFQKLNAGDLLFIDSSHVSKAGSDVNFLMHRILPKLRPGVIVHVHDIFKGFEYPRDWLLKGRAWNEAYLLKSFLQFNYRFKILLWPQLLGEKDLEKFIQFAPGKFNFKPGSSFYMLSQDSIRKT